MPARWISRGPGGGGAFFAPSMSPFQPSEMYIRSDMSDVFHTRDSGVSWDTLDFRQMQGGNLTSWVQFTADPNVRYGLNGNTPSRSDDAGQTWTPIPLDQWTLSAYSLFADDQRTNRLFISDYSTLYFSTNSGRSYALRFSASDCHIAGAFFDGARIFIGTRAGLVVSTNYGQTFALSPIGGVPGTEAMVSFAGASEDGVIRLFCVTLGAGDVYPGVTGGDHGGYRGMYRLDYGRDSTWSSKVAGVASADHPFFVSMCRTNIQIAYVAGGSDNDAPIVYKTSNGGTSWSAVFQSGGNQNIATGWQGDDPGAWNWRKWSFGEYALGFQVCPSDPSCAVITDLGFVHITTNGGQTWQQAYAHPSDQNAINTPTDKQKSYHGVGIEDTSCWWLAWPESNTLYAAFTDIRGMRSTNGGASWSFPAGLNFNSTYQAIVHPSNRWIFATASSVHDLYAWDRYCQDAYIDNGTGALLYSTNQGASWQTFRSFGRPVVGLALDPGNPQKMYVSLAHSSSGGIYRTTNLLSGPSAAWIKLASPPRTQGHAYNVHVLNDGALLCSYSARINSGNFSNSAGVFVSTNHGVAWLDRSAAGMQYYTKDVVVDPFDTTQQRWYAGVWGEWGKSSGLGGLYQTTNRGVSWVRLTDELTAVESCTVNPLRSNELYVTTEAQGLWLCTNRLSANPTFAPLLNYPFRFPTRVFFNPWNPNEAWVTSYGNGLRMSRLIEPPPAIANMETPHRFEVAAASGQKIVTRISDNLLQWREAATNIVLDQQITFDDPDKTGATQRFYSVGIGQ
ncbi:MAG TPA: hypothetical protein DCZ95_03825 [Verrucomicrobia bacterium]|nr:MAG: hypothetical protein A2X46_02475 [Lentisphaerae bacterium GWF2_57_35]HBA83203.1 hypothetical protein [Verrucomicrobiota bacterium]